MGTEIFSKITFVSKVYKHNLRVIIKKMTRLIHLNILLNECMVKREQVS